MTWEGGNIQLATRFSPNGSVGRSTKRNRRHGKAGEVGRIKIQERQTPNQIRCQRMAWPQQCSPASTVQTRLRFSCSSFQTRFTGLVSRHDSRVLCPDTIHVFCVQTWFSCSTVQTTRWPWLPQYILNKNAEADGLVRSTKRNSWHEKAGEVGRIKIQERQTPKQIRCQRMAWTQQCSPASTVQTRLGFSCSSFQTRFTCLVSGHNSRVLCPDTIPGFCVQTRFTCFVSRHDSPVQLSRQGADHGYPNIFWTQAQKRTA